MTVLLSFGVIAACEVFIRLPFGRQLQRIGKYSASPMQVMRSKHSTDDRKERVLLAYSQRLGHSSLLLLWYLVLFLLPILFAGFIEFRDISRVVAAISSVSFLFTSAVLAAVYAGVRKIVVDGKLFGS